MLVTPLIPLLLAALAPQAMAGMDHTAATCPTTPAALPAGLEGWSKGAKVAAGASAARAPVLTIGTGVTASLLSTPRVSYPVRPEKPGGSVSSGGLFAFVVPSAGRYRVALGSGAWIDVLSGTMPTISVAHSPGPACTGVRKMVDFDLQPGRYLLQVAGNGTPTLPLMVARLP